MRSVTPDLVDHAKRSGPNEKPETSGRQNHGIELSGSLFLAGRRDS